MDGWVGITKVCSPSSGVDQVHSCIPQELQDIIQSLRTASADREDVMSRYGRGFDEVRCIITSFVPPDFRESFGSKRSSHSLAS
jgi:hypothetical protein